MAGELEIINDISTNTLIGSIQMGGNLTLPSMFQGAPIGIQYTPVRPLQTWTAPRYAQVGIDSMLIRMQIGPRAGSTALLAVQDTWTKQVGPDSTGKSGYFYATLDLNTAELIAALGSLETLSTWFEIQASFNGGPWRTVYQGAVTIVAVVRDPTGAASLPTPALAYPTWDQARSAFPSKDPLYASEGFYLRSPGGLIIYVYATDDGEIRGMKMS